jgi:hypothetical protein
MNETLTLGYLPLSLSMIRIQKWSLKGWAKAMGGKSFS